MKAEGNKGLFGNISDDFYENNSHIYHLPLECKDEWNDYKNDYLQSKYKDELDGYEYDQKKNPHWEEHG